MLSESLAQRKWQSQSESSASHPSIWWLRSLASSSTVSSSHTASDLEQTLWAPPSRHPHESGGRSPASILVWAASPLARALQQPPPPPPAFRNCLHSICFSHSDAPLAHSPISDLPSSVSPLSPLVQPPWLPRCPGVHQQPPAPGPLPWRSCCLGCVPQTSAGHTPQPLTPWFRSHLPPRDPPSPRPRDHPSFPYGTAPHIPTGPPLTSPCSSAPCPLASHSCSRLLHVFPFLYYTTQVGLYYFYLIACLSALDYDSRELLVLSLMYPSPSSSPGPRRALCDIC